MRLAKRKRRSFFLQRVAWRPVYQSVSVLRFVEIVLDIGTCDEIVVVTQECHLSHACSTEDIMYDVRRKWKIPYVVSESECIKIGVYVIGHGT